MIPENSAREIVLALYRRLLGREADAGGLAVHQKTLIEFPDATGFDFLLENFLRSHEHKKRIYHSIIDMEIKRISKNLFSEPPNYNFISIGSHCFTSYMLKRAKLKTESFPFDWLFSSNAMVNHCLNDNFRTLLDRSYYRPKTRNDAIASACDHNYYLKEFGIKSVFNHRNPTKDIDYDYLLRTVERFRRTITADKSNLFLATFRKEPRSIADFMSLAETINTISQRALVVGIAIDTPNTEISHSTMRINNNTCLSVFTPSSEWLDISFESLLDDVAIFNLFMKNFLQLCDHPVA